MTDGLFATLAMTHVGPEADSPVSASAASAIGPLSTDSTRTWLPSASQNAVTTASIHPGLASGRWRELTLMAQLGNIGTEVARAHRAQASGNVDRFDAGHVLGQQATAGHEDSSDRRVGVGHHGRRRGDDRRLRRGHHGGVSRLLDRFRLRGIGMDDAGERAQPDPRDDGQRNLVDHLARMTGDNGRAENPVGPFPDMDLHEAGLLAVGDRAMHVVHRYGEGSHRDVLIARLADVEADVGDLGIGVGAPRNRQRAQSLATEEQRVPNYNACRSVGGMRELLLQAGVTGGVNSRIAGLQEIVDPDASGSVAVDACNLQIEALDVG